MKILYLTDLHGSQYFYNKALEIALREKVDVVINGGDMLPGSVGGDIFNDQKNFITDFLVKEYWKKFEQNKIYYLCMLGNDDLKIYDELFDKKCRIFRFIKNIAQKKVRVNGYDIIGFNFVNDYPFRLKDRCLRDYKDFVLEKQFGTGLLSVENGYVEVFPVWQEYIKELPTMEDELKKLPDITNKDKTIFVCHMPPNKIDLDVCQDGRKVGSSSVYKFIEEKQMLFSLHGHIHESHNRTKGWHNKIGDTICFQPGQYGKVVRLQDNSLVNNFTYIIIETEGLFYKRFEEV